MKQLTIKSDDQSTIHKNSCLLPQLTNMRFQFTNLIIVSVEATVLPVFYTENDVNKIETKLIVLKKVH